jgi:hypothetical protein
MRLMVSLHSTADIGQVSQNKVQSVSELSDNEL